MTAGLTGRDTVLSRLRAQVSGGTATRLHLTGEAGIGKSAVVRHLVTGWQAEGVLTALLTPAPPDRQLTYGGLATVLSALREQTARLDPQITSAVGDALGALGGTTETGERSSVADIVHASTLVDIIESICRHRRLVVVIDDVDSLDAASRAIIENAFSRTRSLPAHLLTTARSASAGSGPAAAEIVHLDPLDDAAVRRIVVQRTEGRVDPQGVDRAVRLGAGNPFHAILLATQLSTRDESRRVVPDQLLDPHRSWIAELSPLAHRLLLVAALAASPTLPTISAVTGAGEREILDEFNAVLAQGIITVAEVIRFAHPLYAEAIEQLSAAHDVRRTHQALAELTTGRVALVHRFRARSVGAPLADEVPDDSLASELIEASAHLLEAGSAIEAQTFAEAAVRCATPGRATRAAAHHAVAESSLALGQWSEATDQLALAMTPLTVGGPPGETAAAELEARVTHAAFLLDYYVNGHDPHRLLHQAQQAATTPGDRLLLDLWSVHLHASAMTASGTATSLELASRAVRDAEHLGQPKILVQARAVEAIARQYGGQDSSAEVLESLAEAAAAADVGVCHPVIDPVFMVASCYMLRGDVEDAWRHARTLLDRVAVSDLIPHSAHTFLPCIQAAEATGRTAELTARSTDLVQYVASSAGATHTALGFTLLLEPGGTGVPEAQDRVAAERADHDSTAGEPSGRGQLGLDPLGVDRYFAGIDEVMPTATGQIRVYTSETVIGRYLALGATERAAAYLEPFMAIMQASHVCEPGLIIGVAAHAEALAVTGRLTEADAALDLLRRVPALGRRPQVRSVMRRAESVIASTQGRHEEALGLASEAIELARLQSHLSHEARGRLVRADAARRGRRLALAREELAAAKALFVRVADPLWLSAVDQRLERAGAAGAVFALSPAEQAVAIRAASGATNAQIAAELWLSVKTIEAQLSSAYRKLGISRRAQLWQALQPVG